MDDLKEGLMRSMSEPAKAPPKDLGWMNLWREEPPEYTKCVLLKHRREDVDVGPPHRGLEHVVRCLDGCNIVWRYDSSG